MMRLDEWQKWLESQFLEEDEEPSAAKPPPPAAATAPLPATPAQPPQPARPLPPPVRPESAEDADLPQLDQFMPSLRPGPPAEPPAARPPVAPAAEPGPAPGEAPSTQPAPGDAPEAAPPPEPAAPAQPAPGSPPAPPPAPAVPAAVAAAPAAEAPVSAPPEAAAPAIPPSRRPRYGRPAVTIEAEPLEADALWSLVPRHLRTLLAAESDDPARGSYKREFRESRVELLRRLLDPTLSLEETARLLGVCPTTVRRYTNRGLLTHQRTKGDQRRFRLSDVLRFMEAHRGAHD